MPSITWLASRPAMLLYGLVLGVLLVQRCDRPLDQAITARDVAFQKGSTDAGVAEATPVTAAELRREVAELVADGGLPDLKPWLRRHGARPDSLTTGRLERAQDVPGRFAAGPLPACAPALERRPLSAEPPVPRKPVPFHWEDDHHRFRLDLPDLAGPPRSATFRASQAFDIAIVGIARDGSPLRQEQVAVTEIDPVTGERLGPVRIRDLQYSYVPASEPPRWLLGLGAGGSVGLVPLSAGPVAAGLVGYRFGGPLSAWGVVAYEPGRAGVTALGGAALGW